MSLFIVVKQNKRALYLLWFSGASAKFENINFQMAKWRFPNNFDKIPGCSKNAEVKSLIARGLIYWNLEPVKQFGWISFDKIVKLLWVYLLV